MENFDFLKLNNCYTFNEEQHTYYWNDQKVETSVTAFIRKYYKEFDTETISAAYAKKHDMLQEDVKKMWQETADISALAGTVVHSILENTANKSTIIEDYTKAQQLGLEEQVKERVEILKPKVQKFIDDTKDLLIPIATEYTVGLENKIAGNIDLLAWNNEENEIQIWDYKNSKQIAKTNSYAHCYGPFCDYPDCNYIHYSMQLSFYKALAQRLLGIKIGKMNLVHFNYTTKKNNYNIYEAIDFTDACNKELDKLLVPKVVEEIKKVIPIYTSGILGEVPF